MKKKIEKKTNKRTMVNIAMLSFENLANTQPEKINMKYSLNLDYFITNTKKKFKLTF